MSQPIDLAAATNIFIWRNDAAIGPCTLDQFVEMWRTNQLTKETLFSAGGDWAPIESVIPQLQWLMVGCAQKARDAAIAEEKTLSPTGDYYILREGKRTGPFTLDCMAYFLDQGKLLPGDKVEHVPGDGQYHSVIHFTATFKDHLEYLRAHDQAGNLLIGEPLSGRFYVGMLVAAGLALMGFFLLIFDIAHGDVANLDAMNIRLCGIIAGGVLAILGAIFLATSPRKP